MGFYYIIIYLYYFRLCLDTEKNYNLLGGVNSQIAYFHFIVHFIKFKRPPGFRIVMNMLLLWGLWAPKWLSTQHPAVATPSGAPSRVAASTTLSSGNHDDCPKVANQPPAVAPTLACTSRPQLRDQTPSRHSHRILILTPARLALDWREAAKRGAGEATQRPDQLARAAPHHSSSQQSAGQQCTALSLPTLIKLLFVYAQQMIIQL